MVDTQFRSPLRKLVAFFEASRDKWKTKCQQAKYELKLLKRRFEHLQRNRDLWQQRYREAEAGREQLQAQREHLHDRNLRLQAQVGAISPKKTR